MEKIVLVLGRGIEGCGVTKFTVEHEKYLIQHGYDYEILAIVDKKWSRSKAHSFQKITQVKLEKDEEFEIAKKVIQSGTVIVNSLPPVSCPELVVNRFSELLDLVTKKIAYVHHDHTIHSLRRNTCIDQILKRADFIFAHSTKDSDFMRYAEKTITLSDEQASSNSLSFLFGDDEPEGKVIHKFQPGMFFDEVRAKYWQPIEDQDPRHHKWIGRTTSFKGYDIMFEWARHLMPLDHLVTFEGLEESLAIVSVKEKYDFHNFLKKKVAEIDVTQYYGDKPCLFTQYMHEPMMNRLKTCSFGYQLTKLDERFIENSIEYTHCELAAIGVIPVFRKKYFDVCQHRKTGNPITQDKNTGTIFLPETYEEMAECVELVKKLSEDNAMRDDWREMAFEYYKEHQDASYTFKKFMIQLNNV